MIQIIRHWEGLISIDKKDMKKEDIYFWEAVEIKKEVKKEVKIDIKDIKSKLKEKWVKFFAWANDDKILELAKENSII
jgi:hypothetical protein